MYRASAWRGALLVGATVACGEILDVTPPEEASVDGGGAPSNSTVDAGPSPQGDAKEDSYAAEVRSDNAVAYWRLDEVDGTNGTKAIDLIEGASGFYGGGIVRGVPGALLNVASRSVSFQKDGKGAIAMGDRLDLPKHTSLSVEAWIRWEDINTATEMYVVAKRRLSAPDGYALYCARARCSFVVEDGVCSAPYPPGGDWVHIVGTSDPSALTLYIDGEPNRCYAPAATALVDNPEALVIGNLQADAPSNWVGGIDEVAIYHTALSGERVRAHRAAAGRPKK